MSATPAGPVLRPGADGPRIAVYSCYFGAHEPFNAAATGSDSPAYDRFVFTDHASLPSPARLIRLEDAGEGPAIL